MLTHEDIERRDLVDEYVAHRLSADDRQAFEEHYFACDACFDRVQSVERLAAGIRDAARRGHLPALVERPVRPWGWGPALTLATASMVVVVAGWFAFVRVPQLERQLDAERRSRQGIEREVSQLAERLTRERAARADLDREVANTQPVTPNVPVAILDATRGESAEEVAIPSGVDRVVLWVDVPPIAGSASYVMKVSTDDNRLLQTIAGLRPNARGALAASIAVSALPTGRYIVRVYRLAGTVERLVQESRLQVRHRS